MIAGTATRFHIVAAGTTLTSGQCRPDAAHPADVYECLYTPASGDSGDFEFRVGTGTRDTAGKTLASAYTHADKIKIDTTAPAYSASSVNGDKLTVTFSEDLNEAQVAGTSAFDVQFGGAARTVSSVALSKSTATLTLSSKVVESDTVTVAYTQPSGTDTKLQDLAGNLVPNISAQNVTNATDSTAPTVTGGSSGYYEDAALSTALTGPVNHNDDIYVKVVFSENVGHTVGEGSSARPEINYALGSTVEQFDIVAAGTTLLSGDCRPDAATPADVYECLYTAVQTDNDDFELRVGTGTADTSGNALASAYAHSSKVTIDNTAPTFLRASVSQSALTVTFSETLNSAKVPNKDRWNVAVNNSKRGVNSVAVSGANITLTLASAVSAGQAVTVGYWRSNTQPDAEDLAGNILLGFDGARVNNGGPTVVTASSGYFADANLGTALSRPGERGHEDLRQGGVQRGREPRCRHRRQRAARVELRHRRHRDALPHRRAHRDAHQRPMPARRGASGGRV